MLVALRPAALEAACTPGGWPSGCPEPMAHSAYSQPEGGAWVSWDALPQGLRETSQVGSQQSWLSFSLCGLLPGRFGEETGFLPQDHPSLMCSQ